MPSERIQRRIDQYLDAADAAAAGFDWVKVRENAQAALGLDKTNEDAQSCLAAANERLEQTAAGGTGWLPAVPVAPFPGAGPATPTSFVGGR